MPQFRQLKWMTLGAGFMWGGAESSLTGQQDPRFHSAAYEEMEETNSDDLRAKLSTILKQRNP